MATKFVQWKKTRELLVNKTFGMFAAQSFQTPSFYTNLASEFTTIDDDIMSEDIDCQLTNELKLLLNGYQSENIRLVKDTHGRPSGIDSNPSLPPYARSLIARFSDVIVDLYYIRTYCQEICDSLTFSRYARTVAHEIEDRLDDIILPISMESASNMSVAGELKSLQRLSFAVNSIKAPVKKYSEIIRHMHKDRLVGGQILNMLLAIENKTFGEDITVLRSIRQAVWLQFLDTVSVWMMSGRLEDPCREFFIWSSEGISSIDRTTLLEKQPLELKESNSFVVIPELCPEEIVPYMAVILRAGIYNHINNSYKSKNPSANIKWRSLDISQFIRMAVSIEKQGATMLYQSLKTNIDLDNSLRTLHSTLLKPLWISDLYHSLLNKGLISRNYGEVAEEILRDLTKSILQRNDFASGSNKFVKAPVSVFNELRVQGMKVDSGDRKEKYSENEEHTTLLDRLSLHISLPTDLAKLLPRESLDKLLLLNRVLIKLGIASQSLANSRSQLPRCQVISTPMRILYHFLTSLEKNVFMYHNIIVTTMDIHVAAFNKKLDSVSSVQELAITHSKLVNDIYTDSGLLNSRKVQVIDDLLIIIDSFCHRNMLLEDAHDLYNEWLEKSEAESWLLGQ